MYLCYFNLALSLYIHCFQFFHSFFFFPFLPSFGPFEYVLVFCFHYFIFDCISLHRFLSSCFVDLNVADLTFHSLLRISILSLKLNGVSLLSCRSINLPLLCCCFLTIMYKYLENTIRQY